MITHEPDPPPLIARALPGESLHLALNAARAGRGGCVLLLGEAGLGKSRLLREFSAAAAADGAQVLPGYCLEDHLSPPLAPVVDALRHGLAQLPPAEAAQLAGPLAPELVKLLPELALTLPGLSPTPPLAPALENRRLFEALTRFLGRLAERRPVLLSLEDLQWADETSLDFLAWLARRVSAWPLLLVLTARPDPEAPAPARVLAQLHRERLAREVRLAPLSVQAVDAMLRAMFGWERPVERPLLQAIYALTEGNPFFVEEVAQALVAAGDIVYAHGRWQARPLRELPVPHSLRLIVQQRTSRLSAPARALLALAAVAGHRVDFDLLAALSQQSEADVLALVRELVAASLLVETEPDTFSFRHALTRQAIYSGLLSRERRTWHLALARRLEQRAGEDRRRLAPLSYHYHAAGEWEPALRFALAAGVEAQRRGEPHAALAHLARAAAAAQALEQPLPPELIRARGQAQQMLGRFADAQSDFEHGLSAARAAGDRRAEWQATFDLGYLLTSSDYPRAGDYLRAALALARGLDDPARLAQSLNRLGNWQANVGQPLEALRLHHEAQAIFESLGDRPGLASTLDLIATAHGLTGNLTASVAHYRRAIEHFEALDDRAGLASSLTQLGGSGDEAAGERAIALAADIGWRDGEAYAHLRLAAALAVRGQVRAAQAHGQRGLEIALEIGHPLWRVAGLQVRGLIGYVALAPALARPAFEEALPLAEAAGAPVWAGALRGMLALVCLVDRDLPAAERWLAGVPAPPERLETISQRYLAWAQAELALARGQPEAALALLEAVSSALPDLAAWRDPTWPILCHARGRAVAAAGRFDAALPPLSDAVALYLETGQEALAWRAHADLARAHLARRDRPAAAAALAEADDRLARLAAGLPHDLEAGFRQSARAYLPTLPPLTALQQSKQAVGGLTRRERQVARLVAQGKSNREIAGELFITIRTAKTHVGNILSKLSLRSRTQLAAWAAEQPLDE